MPSSATSNDCASHAKIMLSNYAQAADHDHLRQKMLFNSVFHIYISIYTYIDMWTYREIEIDGDGDVMCLSS